MAKITTSDLVNKIYTFCCVYNGVDFFPYQAQFSKRIIRSVIDNDGDEITGLISRQGGKCFGRNTPILMGDGTIKKVQDIVIGDYVMSPNSKPVKVVNTVTSRDEMFEVVSREKNHESFIVNKAHILSVIDRKQHILNIPVGDYLKLPEWRRRDDLRGYRVPVEFEEKNTPIEPYFYGLWLGDGGSYDVKITNTDNEVIDYIYSYAEKLNMQVSIYKTKTSKTCFDYAITATRNHSSEHVNPIRQFLVENNLIGNKHITKEFMLNSRSVRLEVLAGLIDSNGHKNKEKGKENTLEITFSNKKLAYDVLRLIRSLGFRASISSSRTNKGTFRQRIRAYGDFSCVPTKVARKQYNKTKLRENPLTFGFDLVSKGIGKYYGFTIESEDNLFLLGDYTVTHNSEVVAGTAGGLAIILPILANTPMFINDTRLEMFKKGIYIGIYAPVLSQAQIIYNRIRGRMNSEYGQNILKDPGILVDFDVSNGQNISLNVGSRITCKSASEGSNIEGDSYHIIIGDEAQDIGDFKYSKSISPMAAFYNGTKILIGTPTTEVGFFYSSIERNKRELINSGKRRNHFEYDCNIVAKYNTRYAKYLEGEKVRLGESSDEFQMSYMLKWMLQRGMFITVDQLMKLADNNAGISYFDNYFNHVAGLDLGKEKDSTVLTILEVDWEHPVIVEQSKELNIPDFIVYKKRIKAWLELQGDDWEEQYPQIMDFMSNYRIARLVIDATGLGSPIYSRIAANVDFEVIPYVFSTPSKSELMKHFDSELKSQRMFFPANDETKNTIEYRKYILQMTEAIKSYSGSNMVVGHPTTRDAHDDYVYSCALACWGAKGEGVDKPVTEENMIRKANKQSRDYYKGRNALTARRR